MSTLRNIGVIAVHQLRRVALDGALLWLIALPLLIIYVLGITLQGVFASDFVPKEPFRIVVAAGESTAEAEILSTLKAMPDYFEVEVAASEGDARRSVLEREADVAVVVPGAFPEQKLTVVAAPGAVAGDIVADVLESGAASTNQDARSARQADQSDVMPWLRVGAFEYYSVGITIMFTMFGAHSAMVYCVGDRVTGAYARTRALGVSRAAYLAAGFVSALLVGAAFITVMTGITRVLFGVSWGPFTDWFALTVSGAAAVAGISFLLMTVLPPNPKGVENAGGVVYTILAFIGGSTVPLPALPEWFSASLSWLPNRALLDGYLALATGGLGDLTENVLINIVTAAVLFTVAWSVAGVRTKGEA